MDKLFLTAESTEQAVWHRLWQAADANIQEQLGMSTKQFLDADCIQMTAVKEWFFNRVIGLGLLNPVTSGDIDKLVTLYHDRALPVGISLCPETKSTDIDQILEKRGFLVANQWVKMIRDNSPPCSVDCELRIEPATDNQRDLIGEVVVNGFGLNKKLQPVFAAMTRSESNHVYIAWAGELPAAVGTLSVVNGIGHLNTAATLAGFRGQGAQGALMARRIGDGLALGCKMFISETWLPGEEPNHSYNNMIRHGFSPAYQRANWVLPCPE